MATRAAETVLAGLFRDGRLRRSWKDSRATGEGVLEDYACLAEGLLALYEATFEERWFVVARQLADEILDRFADPDGGFFDTASDHERLVARPKDIQDNATPSGNATATLVLLRLASLTGDERYRAAADGAIRTVLPFLARHPTAFAKWLAAVDMALGPVAEIAIVGDPSSPDTRELLAALLTGESPAHVVALSPEPENSAVPLLEGRTRLHGRATAYVCSGFACRVPVTDPDALAEQLRELRAAV